MSPLGAGPVFRLRSQDWGWLWLDLVEFCILRPVPEGSGPCARSWCGKWFTAPRPRARGSWARVAGATGCLPGPPGPLGPLWAAMGRYGALWAAMGRNGPLWAARRNCWPPWAALGRSGPLWTALGSSGQLWAALGRSGPLGPLRPAGATAAHWEALGFLGPLWPLRGGGFGESGVRIRARSTYTNTSTTEFHELPSNGLWPQLC